MSDTRCCAKLRGVFMGRCERPGKIVRGGNRYCWQHDPERVERDRAALAEKRKKSWQAFEAKMDARDARHELERAADVRDMTDDELKTLAAWGGLRAILTKLRGSDGGSGTVSHSGLSGVPAGDPEGDADRPGGGGGCGVQARAVPGRTEAEDEAGTGSGPAAPVLPAAGREGDPA